MEWGEARIEADLKRWLADVDRKDREWFAQVPEARKAECGAEGTKPSQFMMNIKQAQLQGQAVEDCRRMEHVLYPGDHHEVLAG
jgi:hypothetical protein